MEKKRSKPYYILPGTVINEKFLVESVIGEGGFGITYMARNLLLDTKVALKEYYPNGCASRDNTISIDVFTEEEEKQNIFQEGKEKFLKEARILARFSDEAGIVTVLDYFKANNTAYIVMEYLEGITLRTYLKQNGTMSFEEILQLLKPVMDSLAKVHGQGLIHRDISPDNIMILKKNGSAKLLDFGAARNVSGYDQRTLSIMLKPGYAPPEQYNAKGVHGPWTDVYGLCATMYHCLTGHTPDDALQRIFLDELRTPSELGIDIPEKYENALMKGLEIQEEKRFVSIEELKKALEAEENFQSLPDRECESIKKADHEPESDPELEERTLLGNHIYANSAKVEKVPSTEQNQKRNIGTEKSSPKKKASPKKKISKSKTNKKKILSIGAVAVILLIVAIVLLRPVSSSYRKNDNGYARVYQEVVDQSTIKSLTNDKKVTKVAFSQCQIKDEQIEQLAASDHITEVSFTDCKGFDSLKALSKNKNIESINLEWAVSESSDITGNTMFGESFPYVKKLWLQGIHVTDGNEFLNNFENLTELRVYEVSGLADYNFLKKMQNIHRLLISHNDLAEVDLRAVATCKNMTDFYAGTCGFEPPYRFHQNAYTPGRRKPADESKRM